MRRTLITLCTLCLVGSTAAMAACQAVAGIDSRAVAAESAATTSCEHADVDAKPDANTEGPSSNEELLLVMDLAISLDRDAEGRTAGFDLDGVCSKESGDNTARTTALSCVTCKTPDQDDDPNGRDNGTAVTLSNGFFRALLNGPKSAAATDPAENPFHLLVALTDYNGQANDPNVTFTFLRSHGLEVEPGGDAARQRAKRDGTDVWSTTDDSYVKVRAPSMVATGWVRDHRAIVKIDRLSFDYAGSEFVAMGPAERLPIELGDVVMMLPLAREGGSGGGGITTVHGGVLTGRWNTKTLLSSLALVPDNSADPSHPRQLCGDDEAYRILRRSVCINADISSRSFSDRKEGTRCDALSIVFNVEAIEGRRGESRFQRPSPVPGCGGHWEDDCAAAWANEGCQ